MNGLYRLLNREFVFWTPFLALLCVGNLIVQLALMYSKLKGYNPFAHHDRYESLILSSGGMAAFLISLVLLCVYFLVSIYAGYWGSKSVYGYLTLPVRREALYFSKLLFFLISLLLLVGVQLLALRLGYSLMLHRIASYHGTEQFAMRNGFYLSVIRSEFVRMVLPLTFSRLFSSFSLLVVLVTGLYYAVLCERSRKYAGLLAVGAAAYLSFKVLVYRMDEVYSFAAKSLYPSSLLLLAFGAWFVWHGLAIVKRGAIA